MNSRAIRRLTAAILSRQIETGRLGRITDERLLEAFTTGPDLSERERSLLLLSPVARDDWNRIRMDILDSTQDQLDELNLKTELVPLAAATKMEADRIRISGAGFSVTLYRQEEQGIPWVILVQLEPVFRNALYPMTSLRLVDEGGLEWLRGRPDTEGELSGAWLDGNIDLYARARKFSLTLEPI